MRYVAAFLEHRERIREHLLPSAPPATRPADRSPKEASLVTLLPEHDSAIVSRYCWAPFHQVTISKKLKNN